MGEQWRKATATGRSITRDDAERGRVIVVDDCPANVLLLTKQLAREGYIVHTASNGDEALDSSRASSPIPC